MHRTPHPPLRAHSPQGEGFYVHLLSKNSIRQMVREKLSPPPAHAYIAITDDADRVRDVAHDAACDAVYAPSKVSVAEEVAADHTRGHTGSGTDWD